MAKQVNPCKVITGPGVRASYLNWHEPRLNDQTDKKEYSVQGLVAKTDQYTIDRLKAAIKEAIRKKYKDNPPSGLRLPLRDGDEEDEVTGGFVREGEEYRGHYYFSATSTDQPGVVDANRVRLEEASSFVSGDYCRISCTASVYDFKDDNGARVLGIKFYLNNLMMTKRGEPLSASRVAAEEEDWGDLDDSDVQGSTDAIDSLLS